MNSIKLRCAFGFLGALGLYLFVWPTVSRDAVGESEVQDDKASSRLRDRRATPKHTPSNLPYDEAVKLLRRDNDPLEGIDLDHFEFSRQYKEILKDETLLYRDRKMRLEILAKSLIEKHGIDYALKHLPKHFGSGAIRNELFSSLFSYSDLKRADLVKLAKTLPEEERMWALGGVFEVMGSHEFDREFLDDLLPLAPREAHDFSYALEKLVRGKKVTFKESLDFLDQAYGEKGVGKKRLTEFFRALMGSDRDMILEHCLNSMGDNQQVVRDIFKFDIRDRMALAPKEAMTELLELRNSHPENLDAAIVADAMNEFLRNDRDAAQDWFAESVGDLSAEVRNQIEGVLAVDSAKQDDFENAWAQAEEIDDQAVRKAIEGEIWNRELKEVRNESTKNPQGLLDGIIEGSSKHDEYWIREGFKVWFSSTPETANKWYSDNERALTPSQSQHVARAYAEVALSDGDVTLARQWAERVVEPEFKEKLVKQIEAASQKKSE
jgi:hypothetical protein